MLQKQDNTSWLREVVSLKIGDTIPNIKLNEGKKQFYLHDLIKDHLFLFIVSTFCDSCLPALETLDTMLQDNEKKNIVLLVSTGEESLNIIKNAFLNRAKCFGIDQQRIVDELFTIGLPWGYGINSIGQIITSFPCSTEEWFLQVFRPFKNIIGENQ